MGSFFGVNGGQAKRAFVFEFIDRVQAARQVVTTQYVERLLSFGAVLAGENWKF